MLAKGIFVLVLGLTVCGLSNRKAQAASSTLNGVYSASQAERGDALYVEQCALCHGTALEGSGRTPALSGEEFTGYWTGRTLADLFDKIHATMPAHDRGRLTREQTADVLAFILSSNKFPSGEAELPAGEASLKTIRIGRIHSKK